MSLKKTTDTKVQNEFSALARKNKTSFKGLTLHCNPAQVVFSDEMCAIADCTINLHNILLQSDTENVVFFPKDLTKELQKIENKIIKKTNKKLFVQPLIYGQFTSSQVSSGVE